MQANLDALQSERIVRPSRIVVAAVGAAFLVTACGESSIVTEVMPSSTEVQVSTAPAPAANEAVTMRMEFPTDEVAGDAAVEGSLVVNNHTEGPVTILDDGCAPKWVVVLANESVPAEAIFPMDCETQPLVLPVGESRLPIRVSPYYGGCSKSAESADGRIPLCVGDTPYAPLPVGSYVATFVGRVPGVAPPAAVPMQVTAAGP